jgi:hypothetical protein
VGYRRVRWSNRPHCPTRDKQRRSDLRYPGRLLGETYRSTEAALKALVDNAWDSDADNVWITLPRTHSDDLIVVRDDGSGMTAEMLQKEYLAIARDRRSRTGLKSAKYNRIIKGRKGIGKFPHWLLNRVFGEIEIPSLPDGHVTADWGAIFENSAPFHEIREWAKKQTRNQLKAAYKRDFDLRKAHLQRDIQVRLAEMPQHRRAFAEEAVNKVLWKFYREHGERFDTLASIILDALEHDEYWTVLQKIDTASRGEVAQFAEALESFELLELAMMSERAKSRLKFLDHLDELVAKPETLEKDMHRALERSLWIFSTKFALMASNRTLRTIVNQYLDKKYSGKRADERPDLLLAQDAGDRYLLIEFKRPSYELTREDEAQATRYRDEISSYFPAKAIDVLLQRIPVIWKHTLNA